MALDGDAGADRAERLSEDNDGTTPDAHPDRVSDGSASNAPAEAGTPEPPRRARAARLAGGLVGFSRRAGAAARAVGLGRRASASARAGVEGAGKSLSEGRAQAERAAARGLAATQNLI